MMSFETQPLRPYALDLFIKRVNLLLMSRRLGLRICLAQFVQSFLNGQLRGFGMANSHQSLRTGLSELKRRLKSAASSPKLS
jgi:hypothetical protein